MITGLSSAKGALQRAIARNRRSGVVRMLHNAAQFFEAGWHNEAAEFSASGEEFVVRALAKADFRSAIDVGANVGNWSRTAVRHWQSCDVHAIEVAPETFRILERTMKEIPESGRVTAYSLGLSDTKGVQTFYYYPGHHDLTSDCPRHAHEALPFEATISTLDAFCGERGIESVDFLKIDVEGSEHRVLRGASEFMAAGKVTCIQFEYGAFSIDTRFLLRDYFDMLGGQYSIGKVHPNHVDFSDYTWRAEDFRFCNYVCVARSRPDLRALLEA